MSTLKVNKLRDTAGSADAITLDPNGGAVLAGVTTVTSVKVGAAVTISESGIEASGIGITCASINGAQIGGRRNLFINGAMLVAQRGTSSTAAGYGSIDRVSRQVSGTDEAPVFSQADVASGTTPYTNGFRKCLKITNGNQTSGAGSSDYLYWWTPIEAQDIANSGWNYTSASSFITISFWIKSSVAQNFYGFLQTSDGTSQSLAYETGSLTADTWTKIIKTIPGNSNLQFDNNNGAGLYWAPARAFDGTDRTGSLTLDTWGTYSGSARTPDATSTWYTTNDATLEFTGLQLEVGTQATAFEHRSFGEELALCQRYYYKAMSYSYTPQQDIPDSESIISDGYLGWVFFNSTNCRSTYFQHPVEMRASPTVTIYSTARATGDNKLAYYNQSAWVITGSCAATVDSFRVAFKATITASMTAGYTYLLGGSFDCSAEL